MDFTISCFQPSSVSEQIFLYTCVEYICIVEYSLIIIFSLNVLL